MSPRSVKVVMKGFMPTSAVDSRVGAKGVAAVRVIGRPAHAVAGRITLQIRLDLGSLLQVMVGLHPVHAGLIHYLFHFGI